MRKEMPARKRSKSAYGELLKVFCGELRQHWQLYVMILLPTIYIIVFAYVPMYGAQIAFRDFKTVKGITGSPWVGLKYIERFVNSYQFMTLMKNTLTLSVYSLAASFPIPILLALSLNTIQCQWFRKIVQMVTYAPYFISTVVMVSIVIQMFDMRYGIVNHFLTALGFDAVMFMGRSDMFAHLYVWSGVWQGMGWSSIIYLSALSSIDPGLHEAAMMDGASRFQRVLHIDLPGIRPTIVMILLLNLGNLLNVGFEKAYLMQNSMNLETSEIISTYVYKIGMTSGLPNYSYSTAIGLFNSVINFALIMLCNTISRKMGEASLW